MNRRRFLLGLGTAAAVIAAPELLLPKRTFFLPPAGGWASGKGDGQLFYEWVTAHQDPPSMMPLSTSQPNGVLTGAWHPYPADYYLNIANVGEYPMTIDFTPSSIVLKKGDLVSLAGAPLLITEDSASYSWRRTS